MQRVRYGGNLRRRGKFYERGGSEVIKGRMVGHSRPGAARSDSKWVAVGVKSFRRDRPVVRGNCGAGFPCPVVLEHTGERLHSSKG